MIPTTRSEAIRVKVAVRCQVISQNDGTFILDSFDAEAELEQCARETRVIYETHVLVKYDIVFCILPISPSVGFVALQEIQPPASDTVGCEKQRTVRRYKDAAIGDGCLFAGCHRRRATSARRRGGVSPFKRRRRCCNGVGCLNACIECGQRRLAIASVTGTSSVISVQEATEFVASAPLITGRG